MAPTRRRAPGRRVSDSNKVRLPIVGFTSPSSIGIVVVLPARAGQGARKLGRGIISDSSSTARMSQYSLVSPSVPKARSFNILPLSHHDIAAPTLGVRLS